MNFWNEPFGTDNAAFITLNTRFYDLVRSQGAENIAVADAMNSGNDAASGGAKHLYDPTMAPALAQNRCNVLFSLHAYGWGNTATTYQTFFHNMRNLKLPVIVGEFGYAYDGNSTAGSYAANKQAADAMFSVAPPAGVGLLWWHATHGDNYSLKKDGSAFYAGGPNVNLSEAGTQYWAISHASRNLGFFTGDYKTSNCASTR